jgi:hypothetical protein
VRPARLLQSPSTDPPPHSLNIPLAIRCLTLSIFLSRLGADSRQPWREMALIQPTRHQLRGGEMLVLGRPP